MDQSDALLLLQHGGSGLSLPIGARGDHPCQNWSGVKQKNFFQRVFTTTFSSDTLVVASCLISSPLSGAFKGSSPQSLPDFRAEGKLIGFGFLRLEAASKEFSCPHNTEVHLECMPFCILDTRLSCSSHKTLWEQSFK